MEGNDIEDLGGGAFRTTGAVNRYSLLDQYAMGLVDTSQVPPFFYVQSPIGVTPARISTSAPEMGVTFNGTRREVGAPEIAKLERIRVAWDQFLSAATDSRMRVITGLRSSRDR